MVNMKEMSNADIRTLITQLNNELKNREVEKITNLKNKFSELLKEADELGVEIRCGEADYIIERALYSPGDGNYIDLDGYYE